MTIKTNAFCHDCCGSVGWALFRKAKGHRFHSWSGPVSGLQAWSGPVWQATDRCFSSPLSPSLPLSKNKQIKNISLNKMHSDFILQNEQTVSCQRGGLGGAGWKKVKGLTKKNICITHRHRQQCGDGQREGGAGAGWRQASGVKMRTSVIVSMIKIRKRKKEKKRVELNVLRPQNSLSFSSSF